MTTSQGCTSTSIPAAGVGWDGGARDPLPLEKKNKQKTRVYVSLWHRGG